MAGYIKTKTILFNSLSKIYSRKRNFSFTSEGVNQFVYETILKLSHIIVVFHFFSY